MAGKGRFAVGPCQVHDLPDGIDYTGAGSYKLAGFDTGLPVCSKMTQTEPLVMWLAGNGPYL